MGRERPARRVDERDAHRVGPSPHPLHPVRGEAAESIVNMQFEFFRQAEQFIAAQFCAGGRNVAHQHAELGTSIIEHAMPLSQTSRSDGVSLLIRRQTFILRRHVRVRVVWGCEEFLCLLFASYRSIRDILLGSPTTKTPFPAKSAQFGCPIRSHNAKIFRKDESRSGRSTWAGGGARARRPADRRGWGASRRAACGANRGSIRPGAAPARSAQPLRARRRVSPSSERR